jgi:hypothetical protein
MPTASRVSAKPSTLIFERENVITDTAGCKTTMWSAAIRKHRSSVVKFSKFSIHTVTTSTMQTSYGRHLVPSPLLPDDDGFGPPTCHMMWWDSHSGRFCITYLPCSISKYAPGFCHLCCCGYCVSIRKMRSRTSPPNLRYMPMAMYHGSIPNAEWLSSSVICLTQGLLPNRRRTSVSSME